MGVFVAGILGSFEQDLVFLALALLLFGRRLPEVASTLGKKIYQFRRGIDEMKAELAKPLRDQIEAPLREAAQSARAAMLEAKSDVDRAVDAAAVESPEFERAPDGESQQKADPFPYPRVPGAAAPPPPQPTAGNI